MNNFNWGSKTTMDKDQGKKDSTDPVRAAVLAAASQLPMHASTDVGIAVNKQQQQNHQPPQSSQLQQQSQPQPLSLPLPVNHLPPPDGSNWAYGQYPNPQHPTQIGGPPLHLPMLVNYGDPKDNNGVNNNLHNENVNGYNGSELKEREAAKINAARVPPELTPAVDDKGNPVIYHGKPLTNTKRAAQNRAAQRAFRYRKEMHIKELENKSEENRILEQTAASLRSEISSLKSIISTLESRLAIYENGGNNSNK